MNAQPTIRFAAVGLNHGHIYNQIGMMLRAGAELASFHAKEPELVEMFHARFPDVPLALTEEEVLEDERIQLVVSAGIPSEREPLGARVLKHGKDFMSDKPAFTSLAQLEEARRVQKETGQIYAVCYSERLESPAVVRAGELVKSGAIGEVVQTVGFGPHRLNLPSRPEWFFQREKYGGIICDIGAHQMDQFLYFTGATKAEVVSSQVANRKFPQYPELEDFGEATLRTETATGFMRVDWFTPDGLPTWGDGRLFVLGTEGYVEVRMRVDLAGREGPDHLFWVDHEGMHYENCSNVELPYGRQLVYDVVNRTETAMTQEHAFFASQLALEAQAKASRLGNLKP